MKPEKQLDQKQILPNGFVAAVCQMIQSIDRKLDSGDYVSEVWLKLCQNNSTPWDKITEALTVGIDTPTGKAGYSYLKMSARSVILDRVKKENGSKRHIAPVELEDLDYVRLDRSGDRSPMSMMLLTERDLIVKQKLLMLPSQYQDAIRLNFYHDFPLIQVADITGTTVEGAKKRWSRSLTYVRENWRFDDFY